MISGFFEGLPVSTVEYIVGVCTAAEFRLENLNRLLEMYHRNPLNEYGYMMVFCSNSTVQFVGFSLSCELLELRNTVRGGRAYLTVVRPRS